jgi:hypothetical protein
MPKKSERTFVVEYTRKVLVDVQPNQTATDALGAVLRAHSGIRDARVTAAHVLEDLSALEVSDRYDEWISGRLASKEQHYDIALSARELRTLVEALAFYEEHPDAPQIDEPLSRDPENSEIGYLQDRLENLLADDAPDPQRRQVRKVAWRAHDSIE